MGLQSSMENVINSSEPHQWFSSAAISDGWAKKDAPNFSQCWYELDIFGTTYWHNNNDSSSFLFSYVLHATHNFNSVLWDFLSLKAAVNEFILLLYKKLCKGAGTLLLPITNSWYLGLVVFQVNSYWTIKVQLCLWIAHNWSRPYIHEHITAFLEAWNSD